MTQNYHQIIDSLPPLPAGLAGQVDRVDNNAINWQASPRTAMRDGQTIKNCFYHRYAPAPAVVDWVDHNISREYCNVGISFLGGSDVNLPHRDSSRDFTLTWVLDTGGPAVQTIFWRQKGHPLHREPGTFPTTWDDLECVDHVTIKKNTWVLLDATVIHSVEGLTHTRTSLQIGFRSTADFVKNRWK